MTKKMKKKAHKFMYLKLNFYKRKKLHNFQNKINKDYRKLLMKAHCLLVEYYINFLKM